MVLKYFNYTHIITLLAAAAFIAVIYFALRNRTVFAKEIALYIMMTFNITQHFFKFLLWPHLWGMNFGIINTAYNVCAILIIATPFVYVGNNSLLKQFVAYIGTIGPLVTLCAPYWFNGVNILKSWEFLRFWTCHTVLVATSLLPAMWGLVKFNYRDGWKFGLLFLLMLSLILTNDVAFLLAFGNATTETLYNALLAQNPLWIMSPKGGMEGLKSVFEALSPKLFLETETHPYIPILWYAIPMYLFITILGYVLGGILDRKRLVGERKSMLKFKRTGHTIQSVCGS